MDTYAVIETGGKQYMVKPGDKLKVERLPEKEGEKVSLNPIAVSDGSNLSTDAAGTAGAKVTAEVVEHIRGKKVVAFKRKRRKGYKKKTGHRQNLTVLKVENIL